MSTTFEVYPRTKIVPKLNELIELSNKKINEYFRCFGMEHFESNLEAFLMYKHEKRIAIDYNMDLGVLEEYYNLGICMKGLNGAFWLRCYEIDDLTRECWEEEESYKDTFKERCVEIKNSIDIGHYWDFTRYAGQPGIINLAYGITAASLAELTNGLIYSSDSAWDYDMFPATPQEFYSWYLRPDQNEKEKYKELAQESIIWMKDKLSQLK